VCDDQLVLFGRCRSHSYLSPYTVHYVAYIQIYTSLYRRLRQYALFSRRLSPTEFLITQWSNEKVATIAWYAHVGIYWAIYSRTFVTVRCCANTAWHVSATPRPAAARKRAVRDREQPGSEW